MNFAGKAVLSSSGVDFSNGNSYKIRMDELDIEEELGRGKFFNTKVAQDLTIRLGQFGVVNKGN